MQECLIHAENVLEWDFFSTKNNRYASILIYSLPLRTLRSEISASSTSLRAAVAATSAAHSHRRLRETGLEWKGYAQACNRQCKREQG